MGRLYNLSVPEKEMMHNYISESLASGIIRPSSSPVAAGFFFVAKKDGSLRPCIDYRQLNSITVKNKYPLPLLSSTFEPLTHATVFTKLDLRNAYHLVRIREGDEWKTAFNTHLGHFEYLVMPFGLTNAPAVFQALVKDVLRDFLNSFVVVYLDDILIFSRTTSEHTRHIRQVLQRLLENRLRQGREVRILRYLCGDPWPHPGGGTRPGRSQEGPSGGGVAVTRGPHPAPMLPGVCKLLSAFHSGIQLGRRSAYWVARPYSWSPEVEAAFTSLKLLFTTAPAFAFPDPSCQFIVEVDASDMGIGGVLSQRAQEDQQVHPVGILSRRFSPAERNYDMGNRELLAMHAALEALAGGTGWRGPTKRTSPTFGRRRGSVPGRRAGPSCSAASTLP